MEIAERREVVGCLLRDFSKTSLSEGREAIGEKAGRLCYACASLLDPENQYPNSFGPSSSHWRQDLTLPFV